MKRQIVIVLVVLMTILSLSGMAAAQSVGDNKKCDDGHNGILTGTLSVTGGKTKTNTPHDDDKCKDKEDHKNKKDDKNDDKNKKHDKNDDKNKKHDKNDDKNKKHDGKNRKHEEGNPVPLPE